MTSKSIRRFSPSSLVAAALGLALAAGAAFGQDLGKRPGTQSVPIAITNAMVHPVSSAAIERGYVLFEGGRISAVGAMEGAPKGFPDKTRVIDAKGKHVYPGLIAAQTQTGLTEIGAVRASQDANEVGESTPEVQAATAVNPDSTLIPVTRLNGVLAAGVFPTGGLIPGRVSVMRFEGWTNEDMTVKKNAGLVVAWPAMRTVTAWWMDKSEDEQRKDIAKNIARLRDTIATAKSYLAAKDAPGSTVATDVRWEAMRGVFASGSAPAALPVFIEAQEYEQITAAVTYAMEQGMRPVIVGGRDAPLCAELLKKHDVPVIVLGTHQMPRRDDSAYDEAFTLPARLKAAGVRFCLASGEETPHERNLPYNAARAAAYGLDRVSALASVTLWGAQILGVGDVLGSLEKGKEATLIVTDGDVLEVATNTEMAFVQGKEIELSSKQSVLAQKYREKYAQEPAAQRQAK